MHLDCMLGFQFSQRVVDSIRETNMQVKVSGDGLRKTL